MAWGPNAAGAPSTPAQAAPNPGVGSAVAQSFKVNPTIAGLSLGIGLGVSLAGHQNTVSQAESRAIDLGIIGTTLAAEGCDGGDPTLPAEDQPQPLRVDSREEGAADGKTESEANIATKAVQATSQPLAIASTTTAPLGIPGVLEIGPGRTETRSGFIDGAIREAVAISDVAYLKIGGGALTLNGLHWESIHRSGGAEASEGSFTVATATAGSGPLAIPLPLDPATILDLANSILGTLGVIVTRPVAHEAAGIMFVDPLRIGVVPNATRDAITGGLINAIQPIREPLFDALLKLDCGNATYITVLDAAIGSITGAGSFTIELGGVQATTGDIDLSSLLGGSTGGVNEGLAGPVSGGFSGPASGGFTPPAVAPAVTPAPTTSAPAPATSTPVSLTRFVGSRGGAMAALAGAGLLLLAAVAELDRRKMRRAQREMPVAA